jgi:hypothetical protein
MSIKQVETLAADGKKPKNMSRSFQKKRPVAEDTAPKIIDSPLKDDDWKYVEKTVGGVKAKDFKSQGWRVLSRSEKLPGSGPAVVVTIRGRDYALVRIPIL